MIFKHFLFGVAVVVLALQVITVDAGSSNSPKPGGILSRARSQLAKLSCRGSDAVETGPSYVPVARPRVPLAVLQPPPSANDHVQTAALPEEANPSRQLSAADDHQQPNSRVECDESDRRSEYDGRRSSAADHTRLDGSYEDSDIRRDESLNEGHELSQGRHRRVGSIGYDPVDDHGLERVGSIGYDPVDDHGLERVDSIGYDPVDDHGHERAYSIGYDPVYSHGLERADSIDDGCEGCPDYHRSSSDDDRDDCLHCDHHGGSVSPDDYWVRYNDDRDDYGRSRTRPDDRNNDGYGAAVAVTASIGFMM